MTEPYAKSAMFNEETLPAALRNDHRTKAGTWGLLRVFVGEVRLVFVNPPSVQHVTPDCPAIIPPQATHHVVTMGPMRMQVEFYRDRPIPDLDCADG